jgi:small-conductance mechanosensitive channel
MELRTSSFLQGLDLSDLGEMTVRDLWSLQGLLIVVVVLLTGLYARHHHTRQPRSVAHSAPGSHGRVKALIDRLLPAVILCALSLAAVGICRATGQSGSLLLVLFVLGGVMLLARVVMFVVARSLALAPHRSFVESAGGWVVWGLAIVFLAYWLVPSAGFLESLKDPVAGTRVSFLDAIRVVAVLLSFVAGAFYLGVLIERRVLALDNLPIGMRVGVAKVTRVMLVVVAAIMALDIVGLDLTALTVVGGAVGVGVGFGLQRIASNFISGFVLLGDRSIRPGDVITIGTRFGVVRELRARYVVVRDRDGVDTLIPNENIITSEVINWSYGDRQIRLKLPLQISYHDNPRQAMALMESIALAHPRVERKPAPAARVMSFAESGIELELRFWIRDPEDGVNNVRSDLYLEVWDAFKAASITIPYPQRDVHLYDTRRP